MELKRVTRTKIKVVVSHKEYSESMLTWCENNWGPSSRKKSREWRYGWASLTKEGHNFWFTNEHNAALFMLRWI